jgi:hypothetical protein
MRMRMPFSILILCLVVSGCVNGPTPVPGSPGPTSSTSASGAPGTSGASSGPAASFSLDPAADDFTAPANPLNLTITSDPSRSATAHVTTDGGSLSATGADGMTFTLDIPKDALAEDTDITMTPVTDVQGWDVAPGNVAAVTLEPDGLTFAAPGSLTITPAQPIGDVQGAPFQFHGQGTDAHLILADQSQTGIVIPVEHFSGHGFSWNVGIPFWLAWARYRQTQAEARLDNLLAAQLGLIHAQLKAGLTPDRSVQDVIDGIIAEWERDILNKRLLLVSNSCADAQFALNGFLAFNRRMQLLGLDRRIEPPHRLFNLARYICAEEATRSCFETGDVERLRAHLLNDEHTLALFGDHNGGDTHAYMEACDRFTLDAEEHSEQSTKSTGQEVTYEADLTLEIELRYDGDPTDSTGGLLGKTTGEAVSVFKSGKGVYAGPGFACTFKIKGGLADIPFQATLLGVDYINTGPERSSIRLKDIRLQWTPGHQLGIVTLNCPGGSSPYGTQHLPFAFNRFKTQSVDTSTSISGWAVDGHPVMATKTFTRTEDEGDGGTGGAGHVSATETIKLKLIHTPGPMPPRPDIP